MQYGLRCHLAIGGRKFAPPGLGTDQLQDQATGVVNLIANILVKLRAAETVIKHYGLDEQYAAQEARAQADVERLLGKQTTPQQQADLSAVVRAIQKAGKKNGNVRRFPSAG